MKPTEDGLQQVERRRGVADQPASFFERPRRQCVRRFGQRTFNARVQIEAKSTWTDDRLAVHKGQSLGSVDHTFQRVVIGTPVPISADSIPTIGTITSPPRSHRVLANGSVELEEAGGVFNVTVLVTETDKSRAKEVIERAAKLVGDNREKIISYVKEQVGGEGASGGNGGAGGDTGDGSANGQ